MTRHSLERDFICPKCRGRGALAQEVNLASGIVALMLPPTARFVAVSCRLCGYTEFYNQAALARCEEPADTAEMVEDPRQA